MDVSLVPVCLSSGLFPESPTSPRLPNCNEPFSFQPFHHKLGTLPTTSARSQEKPSSFSPPRVGRVVVVSFLFGGGGCGRATGSRGKERKKGTLFCHVQSCLSRGSPMLLSNRSSIALHHNALTTYLGRYVHRKRRMLPPHGRTYLP